MCIRDRDCWGIVAPMIAGTMIAGSGLVIESEKKGGDGDTSVFRVDENGCTLYDCDMNIPVSYTHLDP